MRILLGLAICVCGAAMVTAEDAGGLSLDEILKSVDAKDPFTRYLALKDLDAWASQVGPEAETRLRTMYAFATGKRALRLEAAIQHLSPGEPLRPSAVVIEDVLDRLGAQTADPEASLKNLDEWISDWGVGARTQLESLKEGASEKRLSGIAKALARFEKCSRALALQRAATGGDELKAWRIVNGASGLLWEEPREFAAWSCEEPKRKRELFEGYRDHPDPAVALRARDLVGFLDVVIAWEPVRSAFGKLELPSVARLQRAHFRAPEQEALAEMPGSAPGCGGGWILSGSREAKQVLFGDGCERRVKWTPIDTDFETDAQNLAGDGPQAFWVAALDGCWALERGNLLLAAGFFGRAQAAADRLWPGAGMAALADRFTRLAADYALRRAGEPTADLEEETGNYERLARFPLEDCQARAAEGKRRLRRQNEESVRWVGVTPRTVLSKPVREQAGYWIWRLIDRGGARERPLGAIVASIDRADASESLPESNLAALGWDAVPRLLEGLGDTLPTNLQIDGRALQIGEVCLLVLRSIFGERLKLAAPAPGEGPRPGKTVAEVQEELGDLYLMLTAADAPKRWSILREAHSVQATDWLLRNDPARCAADVVASLPASGRARDVGLRILAEKMATAPREKLELLLFSADGDLKEAVQSALERGGASK